MLMSMYINGDTYISGTGKKLNEVDFKNKALGGFYIYRDCHSNLFTSGSGDNYLVIRTPIPYESGAMWRIVLEGYLYRNQSPLHLEVCGYCYTAYGYPINMGWWGIGPDEVKVGYHEDSSGKFMWLVIHFPQDNYFTRFYVRELNISTTHNYPNIWYSYSTSTLPSFTGGTYNVSRRS